MDEYRIGVLSDTHLLKNGKLPREVWHGLSDVNAILHAGDILDPAVLEELECLAPTYAVQGNCDVFYQTDLPDKRIVEFNGVRIGITHGHLGRGRTTPERALQLFCAQDVQVIVFGHSHMPYLDYRDGILLFNPGSPTAKRSAPHYSYGLITLKEGQIKAVHRYF